MEFKQYQKIGSGPIQLREERKLTYNQQTQIKFFFLTGVQWSMEVSKDEF